MSLVCSGQLATRCLLDAVAALAPAAPASDASAFITPAAAAGGGSGGGGGSAAPIKLNPDQVSSPRNHIQVPKALGDITSASRLWDLRVQMARQWRQRESSFLRSSVSCLARIRKIITPNNGAFSCFAQLSFVLFAQNSACT